MLLRFIIWLAKLFQSKGSSSPSQNKKSSHDNKVYKSVTDAMSAPDPEDLGPDEEVRIYKNPETGAVTTKIEKKKYQEPSKSPHPEPLNLKLKTCPSISLGEYGIISKEYAAEEPEDCDILNIEADEGEYLVHSGAIYLSILNSKNIFLTNESEYSELLKSEFIKIEFMDDSRDYNNLSIADKTISIPAHYLGLNIFICLFDNKIYSITENFFDSERDILPHVVTALEPSLFTKSSAKYDTEEEWWELVS